MKLKRILAILGVIGLVMLYASTLVFAIIDHPQSNELLIVSIIGTFFIPIILHAIKLMNNALNKNNNNK